MDAHERSAPPPPEPSAAARPRAPSWTWFDGRFVAPDAARLPFLSHALHYGSGVFEGIRAYSTPDGPRLFELGAHLVRLRDGAARLGLGVDLDTLAWACEETVARNGYADAYVRPVVWWGAGGLGLDVGAQTQHVAVAALPWTSHLGGAAADRGVRATFSPLRRNSAAAIPPLKLTGGYVNAILAKRAAAAEGFEEAIFLDAADRVVEATGENVFAVFGSEVVAAAHADALAGITRRVVLELAGGSARTLTRAELLTADEVFLTGTSAEVTPVRALGEVRFGDGPVTRRLQRAYLDLVHGRAPRAAAAAAHSPLHPRTHAAEVTP